MKKLIIVVAAILAFVLLVRSNILRNDSQAAGNQDTTAFYSSGIKKVVDAKCYGCHSIKGKSQKAKDKLMWDSLPGLPKNKIVSTLDDMVDVLDKNEMPPEEFLKKFPDAALLADEKATLRSWAEAKADSLLK
ncbi:MAG TPA: heme-binding domain-containing protein [Lentimicrobium sp.]|nr:heme-binding domain-containing protein [Lentimicrobium sp.]